MKILVINAGSSTHKLSLYDIKNTDPIEPLWTGLLEWGREQTGCSLSAQSKEAKVQQTCLTKDNQVNLKKLITTMWEGDTKVISSSAEIERIGHRVVHGGQYFQQPVLINEAVKSRIRQLIPLAPLHNPRNLEGIELLEKLFPSLSQYAVFDTAFHAQMSEVVKTYPVPYDWKQEGIQRYGFHGISHQYCSERIPKLLNRPINELKIINCHLGNGASLCAIQNGQSVDTTMGFTPLEGLMMGSRCGSIDPSILLYCLREKQMTPVELEKILNFESGLKGIGGVSDMREIEKSQEERVRLALEMYIYRLNYFIGALSATLKGINVLSFTAGIGENSQLVRKKACEGLHYLGIEIDEDKNQTCYPDQDIATDCSKLRVCVIHTQEEWMIAKQVKAI